MNDVTRILSAIEQGDPSAADQLLPLVYGELRKLAALWDTLSGTEYGHFLSSAVPSKEKCPQHSLPTGGSWRAARAPR